MSIPSENADNDDTKIIHGRKSIRYANKNQIEFTVTCLDDLIPKDHRVRDVWEYTSKLNLSCLYENIKVLEGRKGPPTADPRILLALWLYATLEGVVSARHLARLCTEHHAYIWLCGGVSVNYHSLSDFRTKGGKRFDILLEESIAILWKAKIIKPPEEVAQDGTRAKASAGTGSLKTEATLVQYLEKAHQFIENLKKEQAANPAASSQREKSAQEQGLLMKII
jgi:transposase